MNKKLSVSLVLILALAVGIVAATVSGYKLFTAVSHFNVQEGVEVQYYDGALWQPLAVSGGTFDLGTTAIKPGETNSFLLRARNTASSGALDLHLVMENIDGLSHNVLCVTGQSEGLEYTTATNDYHFKAVGDSSWKAIQIDTTATGDMPVGEVEFDNTLTRGSVLTSYGATC